MFMTVQRADNEADRTLNNPYNYSIKLKQKSYNLFNEKRVKILNRVHL